MEDHCKHEAAVFYELLHNYFGHDNNIVKREIPTKQFKNKNSGEFRTLEILGDDFYASILSYSPSKGNYQLQWGQKVKATLVDDVHIEISIINPQYVRSIPDQILLKCTNGEVAVKCETCNTTNTKFCEHQALLLNAVGSVLRDVGVGKPDFSISEIRSLLAKKLKIKASAIDLYYEINLSHKGFVASPKENLVDPSKVRFLNNNFNRAFFRMTAKKNERFLKAEEGRPARYAFLWEQNNSNVSTLKFMRGYGLKTKEGIHTNDREVEEYPNHFPPELASVGKQIKLLSQDENVEEATHAIRDIIIDNVQLLNGIYNYFVISMHHYDSYSNRDLHRFKFNEDILDCEFLCQQEDGFIQLSRIVKLGQEPIDYSKSMYSNMLFSIVGEEAYVHRKPQFHMIMNLFGERDTIIFEPNNKEEIIALLAELKSHFTVRMINDVLPEEVLLSGGINQIFLKEWNDEIVFEPYIVYDDKRFTPLLNNQFRIDKKIYRPSPDEVQFLRAFIRNAHSKFMLQAKDLDYVHLDYKSMLEDDWFQTFMLSCESAGIQVLGQKELRKFKYSTKKAIAATHVNTGIRWFDVTIDLAFDKEKIKKADWIRAIKNNESYVTLKDGTLGVLPSKWIEQVKKILAVAEVEKEAVKISKYRFNIIEEIFENIEDEKLLQELQDKKKKFLELDFGKKHKIPKVIKAELRDYQYAGYQWLKFLDESEFGGILADDMGLGKTLQVLCLLAGQKKKGSSLVIVPRTLLYNWSAEIERFCPSLSYRVHHGVNRAAELSDYKNIDIIISTYGTVLSDIEKFKDENYNYIVLDESQAIKNPNSLRYKAMKLLNARNKLAMTGTPIENNTMDLYAQLNFVVPGLLGTISQFKTNFAIPIDNRGNAEAADLLRKLIRPFMLRRTKEQVAKDLPDKTESIIYCEMGEAQRKLYEELKEKIRQDVHSKVEESGVAKSKFFMLDGLLRLRQLCNSPLLVNSAFTGAKAKSTKIDLLCERLTQNLEGQNTLIFSQFVGLLTIVKNELDKRKITYAYLDGATRNRKAEVDKFMDNEDVRIFIISIKAGNTGMNLTKADNVYILDPWWNPAVEAQAIDRTHRIGQDKKVFAYKLICKDTIEEKIIQLQERKKNLAKDIIQVDENILKSLNKTDLLALFD